MDFDVRRFRVWRWFALALFALPVASYAQAATGVGFRSITIHDPVNGGMMPGYVFYPSADAKGVTWVGPYELHATRNAAAISGAKPLVVISHGHGGSDLGHHDLAVYLASRGFIAATLEHPKDNFHDMSGTGTPLVLDGRPIQVEATITHLLVDPHWKNLIDPDRIGVAGFAAGGTTALLVVGAVPRLDRFIAYCTRHPADRELCGDTKQMTAQLAMHHQTIEGHFESMQKQLAQRGSTNDSRVKAAFVMAPISFAFDKAGLASVDRPVYLYYGQDDRVLLPKENVLRAEPLIRTLAGIRMIPKAGHYVFMSPCSARLAKDIPMICKDSPGVDRVKVHKRIDADALTFFRKTLGIPAH